MRGRRESPQVAPDPVEELDSGRDRSFVRQREGELRTGVFHQPSCFHQQHYSQCCAIIVNVVHDSTKACSDQEVETQLFW